VAQAEDEFDDAEADAGAEDFAGLPQNANPPAVHGASPSQNGHENDQESPINFDHDFPKNLALGPIHQKPAAPAAQAAASANSPIPETVSPETSVEDELQLPAHRAELTQSIQQPEAAAVASVEIDERSTKETVPELSHDAKAANEVTAMAPPERAPKPKPVRTGPARKGWWQRSV
jgi:hypothetical protein